MKNGVRMRKIRIIIIIEIICLIPICFGAYKVINHRAEVHKQELAAQEAAERQKKLEEEKNAKEAELKKWNMILVNSDNTIPDNFEIETAEVENDYVVDIRIRDALKEMLADCRSAGYSPRLISTFRTRETQQYLYDHTANKADTAIPGHSEHECGLAADIVDANSMGWGDPLVEKQEDMPAQKWLMENCQNYGFILRYPKDKESITKIIYEPWHYRYVGKEHAKAIMEKGVCLEEYIDNF